VTSGRGVDVAEFQSGTVTDSMKLLVRGHEDLDYGKVHEVRAALEVLTAGLAAQRAQPKDVERMQVQCELMEAALDRGDSAEASECDFEFHREITRAAGNELLVAMLDSVADVLKEVRVRAMVHRNVALAGLKAHRRLLNCISQRKPEAARAAMEAHLAEAARAWRVETRKAEVAKTPSKRLPKRAARRAS
jgi:GntR family transcriptional regulator, transcriptional repressor for pyruvate dehydrogenase complex